MTSVIVVAGIISILSIFVFFGDAFANTGGTVIPNMFHLMFGSEQTYNSYVIEWKQYSGLTFIFGIEIVMIVLSIIAFYVAYQIKNNNIQEDKGIYLSSIQFILAITGAILSFSTLGLTNMSNIYDAKSVTLGFGPVFYGVLCIIVAILHLSVILICIKSGPNYQVRRTSAYRSVTAPAKPSLSENEKADLLLKYKKMMDEGVITKEEFENKKKNIL